MSGGIVGVGEKSVQGVVGVLGEGEGARGLAMF